MLTGLAGILVGFKQSFKSVYFISNNPYCAGRKILCDSGKVIEF
jgi:hypothetical protein